MNNLCFKALIVEENSDGNFSALIKQKHIDELPQGDVIIKVAYSCLNYKDYLSFAGNKGVTKKYPHTPGIDASGIVVSSQNSKFKEGDKVLVTGYDLGMNTSGAFAEYIRVPAEWIVPLPDNLTLKESMIYGTAGFTDALAIMKFQSIGITSNSGKILVTGATGAVGTLAISILKKLGYTIIASTGKPQMHDFLRKIGASEIISRSDVVDETGRPLLKRRWKAVIETVGGKTLDSVIRATDNSGAIAVIGNRTGDVFTTSVYPFILRGITLFGIETAETEMPQRLEIWQKLANEWKINDFESIYKEVSLNEIIPELEKMKDGTQAKKVIVNLER
ncbi:MAG: YhdH/YhfP family quinone oxidoreductase [Chloroherpetonaceae bacterium]